MVTIYTKPTCPFCIKVKHLLDSLDISYTEVDVIAHPSEREQASARAGGWNTVPMIFVGDTFLGGCDDIYRLHDRGELMTLCTQ